MLATILRTLRTEIEKLLAERLARQHTTGRNQAAFLINNYDLIVSLLAERGAISPTSPLYLPQGRCNARPAGRQLLGGARVR